MRTSVRRLVVLLAVLVPFSGRAAGQNDNGWLGRDVLAKTPHAKLKIGHEVVDTAPEAAVLHVQQVQGQWLWLGTGWVQASEVVPLDDAVAFFTKQIESSPSSFAYLSRSQAYLARDRYILALWDLRRVAKRLRSLETLSTALGENTAGKEPIRPDVAKKLLKLADHVVQNNPDGYSLRADLYLKLGRLDDAIADLTSAIHHDNTDPMLFDTRASAWERKGNFEQALEDHDQAIRLNRNEAFYFSNRADLRLKLGHENLALQDYSEASRLEPQERLHYWMQAAILATSGRDGVRDGRRAVELATKACQLSQWRDASDLFVLGAAYAESGDFESAVRCEAKSLELSGSGTRFRPASQQRQDLYRRKIPLRVDLAKFFQSDAQRR